VRVMTVAFTEGGIPGKVPNVKLKSINSFPFFEIESKGIVKGVRSSRSSIYSKSTSSIPSKEKLGSITASSNLFDEGLI